MDKKIYQFFTKVFRENKRNFSPSNKDIDILNISKHYLTNGNFWCLINKKNDICGTIAIRKLEKGHEIRRFFILKKYQNLGYGQRLLNIVINYAISNNYTFLRAATMNDGIAIHHLLMKYGFTRTHRYNNSNADIFFEFELTRANIYSYKIKYLYSKFENSLILNPTENIPFYYDIEKTNFLSGLYVSERMKDVNDKVIFAGRNEYIEFFEYIKKEWKSELGAYDVDLKTLSGLNAHLILFLCILKPNDKVMILPEICGGHFATEKILKNIGANTYQMLPDLKHHCVDSQRTVDLILREEINYVFVDRSEGLYYEDFSWLKSCKNCYKIFDASQYISSILCNKFRNPFDMGFDMIITTLHKNYPGPQKGLLAVNDPNDTIWKQYLSNAKTYISNTHPKAIADSLLPLLSKNSFSRYCTTCENCTKLLENFLKDKGVPVIKRSENLIPTHHLWILCKIKEESYKYYLNLEELGFLTNYRLLPYNLGYGLRIGLNAAILSGLNEQHISELATIMVDAYNNDINQKQLKRASIFIDKIKTIAK